MFLLHTFCMAYCYFIWNFKKFTVILLAVGNGFYFCSANMLGTQFTIFDNGESPRVGSSNNDQCRQELVAVVYVCIV